MFLALKQIKNPKWKKTLVCERLNLNTTGFLEIEYVVYNLTELKLNSRSHLLNVALVKMQANKRDVAYRSAYHVIGLVE